MSDSCSSRETFNFREYKDIIGSGGFGIIIRHGCKSEDKECNNTVAKFLYNAKSCDEAQIEFLTHKSIFNTFSKLVFSDRNEMKNISMSEPVGFSNETVKININKNCPEEFKCFYVMKLLYPIDVPKFTINETNHNINSLIHLIFKEDEYEYVFNKEVGRVYTEEVSKTNPSRGFFMTTSYITKVIEEYKKRGKNGDIDSITDVLERLGFIFSVLVFGCDYIPRDVEYVLSTDKNGVLQVTVLDFGMIYKLDFSCKSCISDKKFENAINKIVDGMEEMRDIDLYFPYDTDTENYRHFLTGFMRGFIKCIINEGDKSIRKNKILVCNKFLKEYYYDEENNNFIKIEEDEE